MAPPAAVRDVASGAQLAPLVASGAPFALHFWAEWCEPCKQMDAVFAELARTHPGAAFARVEAEAADEVTERYAVSAVPFFVFAKARDARWGWGCFAGQRAPGRAAAGERPPQRSPPPLPPRRADAAAAPSLHTLPARSRNDPNRGRRRATGCWTRWRAPTRAR
jgi:hypothetical protein